MDEPYITFDRERFKQVVHYVIARCDPTELGNVKLHKILYFADMLHFMDRHVPLTGADYIKQQFGPTARHLGSVLDELEREGQIRVSTGTYYGFKKKDYVCVAEPDPAAIGNEAQALLNDVIEFVIGRSAKEISELSHNRAWETAKMRERIPYASVYGLQPVEVTDRDIEDCISEVRAARPEIEGEQRAGEFL
jgi:uncharacterized phage-associated protein